LTDRPTDLLEQLVREIRALGGLHRHHSLLSW
jgi:hypothetical protein